MRVHSREHLAMALDHGKDDMLPKYGELLVRHFECRLQFVDCCIPLALRRNRQVPAHLSDCHRTVHLVQSPVGLIQQRLGISYDRLRNGSHRVTPFAVSRTRPISKLPYRQVWLRPKEAASGGAGCLVIRLRLAADIARRQTQLNHACSQPTSFGRCRKCWNSASPSLVRVGQVAVLSAGEFAG
jgi:hypothetical protein